MAVPTRPGPTVQRRRLGIELRRLREAASRSIDDVAEVLEGSSSKVSRIENGQVSASPRDVRDMLQFYRVDPERREELVEFARVARKKGWWEAYSDTLAVPLVGSADPCVEAALSDDNIIVRDSKMKNGPTLMFQPSEWNAFLNGVKNGEFDLLDS